MTAAVVAALAALLRIQTQITMSDLDASSCSSIKFIKIYFLMSVQGPEIAPHKSIIAGRIAVSGC